MILNHMRLVKDEYPDTIIILRNLPLLNSTELKHIGSYISQNEPNTGDIEVNHRMQMAYAKLATMVNLLQNSKINHETKIKFLNSFLCSRFTYSYQN